MFCLLGGKWRVRAHRRDAAVLVLDSAPCAAAAHIFVGGAFRDRATMALVSFEHVVRKRVMGCARSSVIDEGLEDNIVRPHPEQELAVSARFVL